MLVTEMRALYLYVFQQPACTFFSSILLDTP